jgi:hypothetical protein
VTSHPDGVCGSHVDQPATDPQLRLIHPVVDFLSVDDLSYLAANPSAGGQLNRWRLHGVARHFPVRQLIDLLAFA